jgi:hypothetical protein
VPGFFSADGADLMYGKLFSSMYDGTLYGQWQAIVTLQQLVILADEDGVVDITPPAIAARTSIPLDIIETGIEQLSAADRYSRTPGEDGRRIVLVDEGRPWGWRIVNYRYYRDLASREQKKANDRQRIAAKRLNSKAVAGCRKVSQPVADVAHTDTDTYTDISQKTSTAGAVEGNSSELPPAARCPYTRIVDLYHEMLPDLPRVLKLTNTRKSYLRQRWREDLPDLDSWRRYFLLVAESPFLTGRAEAANGKRPFIADLEWLARPGNIAKVIEGKYHDHDQGERVPRQQGGRLSPAAQTADAIARAALGDG